MSADWQRARTGRGRSALAVSVVLVAVAAFCLASREPVSSFGVYRGYAEHSYRSWIRSSEYVPVRDGTLLAVDLYRPAWGGEPVTEPLPVVWRLSRYHRARMRRGRLTTPPATDAGLERLLEHGYVVAAVDARGTGASFGTRDGPLAPVEADDAYDLCEWFASQPFCDGNVGMFGRSYGGITQFQAAASRPPHLRAILPEMAMFDLYALAWPGGVFREGFARGWTNKVRRLDLTAPAAPVDADGTRDRLRAARAEHQRNGDPYEFFRAAPYRDSPALGGGPTPYDERSPHRWLDDVNSSDVAVFQLAGWYDIFTRDALLWFANLETPRRLVIGPWSHTGDDPRIRAAEMHRWFDSTLKGAANGIEAEAPLRYYVMGAEEWRSAEEWPLPEQEVVTRYLHGRPGGGLSVERPDAPEPRTLVIDYAATSGVGSRWANGYGTPFGYDDLRGNDARGLTFTTDGLDAPLEVTGHPVVRLWITCTAPDVDVVAYLEDVQPDGSSRYVTEGNLRASHRALAEPPFDGLGLPWHDGTTGVVEPLGAEPAELAFDLLPTSYVFLPGHRLRLAVHGADEGNLGVKQSDPPPDLTIHTGPSHPSRLELPLIRPGFDRE